MSIEGILNPEEESLELTPTSKVSDLIVNNIDGEGSLLLLARKTPFEDMVVADVSGTGITPISTSDPAIAYVLKCVGANGAGNFEYYMGP